uniref:Putative large secreted protein n=1 Tax=uncultured bacterium contig00026 TaxID=1181515 RepID=A0A806JY43_9BACT|nr:putative large secreted protein [uncultured bacterium contig00026]
MTDSLIFDSPAERWEEALPLGNGRLGAMIFGSPGREKLQLNEDSIWSGAYRDRNNPAAKAALPEIRRLLNEGRISEAEELCLEALSGIPPAQRVYQTAGELLINFSPDGNFGHPFSGTRSGPLISDVSNYRRELDLSRALHTVSFESGGVVFKRECFISAVADVLVLRFSAAGTDGNSASGKISFRAGLERGVFYDRKGNVEGAAFICREEGIPFCTMIKVAQRGGTQEGKGGFITVYNADEALLFLDIRTGFRVADYEAACLSNLNRSAKRGWEELFREHVEKHRTLYNRAELVLKDRSDDNHAADNTVRYFNFCRYLLISCSQPGMVPKETMLPANLQGLWNPHMDPPWGCGYTININTQMNYWPACMCNLAETEEPLFSLIERMYPNGKKTAQTMYGCRGFTAHHNTDIWGDTAPRDYWLPGSYWVLGAAWLVLHIWEHYEYTQDSYFLKKYFYLLKEACIFFVDFLIPGNRTNEEGEPSSPAEPYLVVSPSVSPENSYKHNSEIASLCAGCEMDNQILRKLFGAAICAAEILGGNDTDTEQFRSILSRLPEPAIHGSGAIREWNEEYEEAEPGHRHFSHLFALWPGDAITLDETPELAAAAKKSIERRLAADGGHTGWSRAWLVNLSARLTEGEAALEHLKAIFRDFTLPNLFNTHPPFQIDGNFGALAGITQMLAQSRIRYKPEPKVIIDILPALPKEWPSGRVKGIRVKGNLELEIVWENGKLKYYTMKNMGNKEIPVTTRWRDNIHECNAAPSSNSNYYTATPITSL